MTRVTGNEGNDEGMYTGFWQILCIYIYIYYNNNKRANVFVVRSVVMRFRPTRFRLSSDASNLIKSKLDKIRVRPVSARVCSSLLD
jgi:hypothetical protein